MATTKKKTRTSEPPESVKAARAEAKQAAKKKRAAAARAQNVLHEPDVYLAQMMEELSKTEAGEGLVTSEQAEQMICGLTMPSLAMRGLLLHDVLPLCRNIMLVGLQGASKSALLAELYRWVLLHKGIAGHIETENKDSPDLRNSLCGYDPSMIRRIMFKPANSQQEWMEALTAMVKVADGLFANRREKNRAAKPKKGEAAADFRARTAAKLIEGKPGYVYPMIYGVDSLTAVSSDLTIAKILAEGSPERRWQIEAQYLSDFAKTLPKMMRTRPMILASTNHLKPGQNDAGLPVDNVPGGKAMRYMNTTELKLTKIGGIKTAEHCGNRVLISCIKNSLGQTDLTIVVQLKWWWEVDEETGEPRQHTVWDWDTATMEYLLAQKKVSAKRWKAVNEVVDLHVPEQGKKTCWSKELGIPSSAPVPLNEAGAMIEARPDILEALYPVLNIKTRTKFRPGVDFADMREHMKRSAEAMAPVYTSPDLSAVAGLDEEILRAIKKKEKEAARRHARDDDDGALEEDMRYPGEDDEDE